MQKWPKIVFYSSNLIWKLKKNKDQKSVRALFTSNNLRKRWPWIILFEIRLYWNYSLLQLRIGYFLKAISACSHRTSDRCQLSHEIKLPVGFLPFLWQPGLTVSLKNFLLFTYWLGLKLQVFNFLVFFFNSLMKECL